MAFTREPIGEADGLRRRLRTICKNRFDGSASHMAAMLGISQPTVWRVLRGQQPIPSGAFIVALSRLPDIDLNWLFRGTGDAPQAGQDPLIPIARQLLHGKPHENRDELVAESVAVAPADFSRHRYFLEVQSGEPIILSEEMKVGVRDLLLMETDRRRFPAAEDLRHVCGIRIRSGRKTQLRLGLVEHVAGGPEDGPGYLEADMFGGWVKQSQRDRTSPKRIRQFVITDRPGQRPTVEARSLPPGDGNKPLNQDLSFDPEAFPATVKYDQIVAVCLQLVRRPVRGVF